MIISNLALPTNVLSHFKVLYQYYPDTLAKSPTVGRQGKALRRQQHRRILETNPNYENPGGFSATLSQNVSGDEGSRFLLGYAEPQNVEKIGKKFNGCF